ncbi:hypothetical protein VDGD_20127 [Verticillium dahliae]|nr:hypothetical protein VDGD_20127 [Verticillium dahliae]
MAAALSFNGPRWTGLGLRAAGLAHIPFTLALLLAALAASPSRATPEPLAWAQSAVALSPAPVLPSASLSAPPGAALLR